MLYSNTYMLKLRFENGEIDQFKHPYLVLLDRNNNVSDKLMVLKGKTFNAIKHSMYIETGQSYGPISLANPTIFNLIEICEIDDQTNPVFHEVDFEELKEVSVALNNAYVRDILTPTSKSIFQNHQQDFIIRLNEHDLL
ncbi:hypothetical protein PT078_07615 [Erysipelothrix rhusiopathiae]|nr:hypothetical protein [Erysipelothrix rhusiopathiae]